MNGQFVFKHAITRFSEAIVEGLQANNLEKEISDIVNKAYLKNLYKRNFKSNDKVHNNIMKYGNTTAASVIIALTEAWEQGKIKEGDVVCFSCFWEWVYLGICYYKMVIRNLN